MNTYCTATYRYYDAKADFHKKAQQIAVGLTVGSWTDLPAAKQEAMSKHLGHVVHVVELGGTGEQRCADITIAYPEINFSRDIPALLVTVFGKLSMDGRIKLTDLSFSPTFLSAFQGPKFGIAGVREQLQVYDRPLLMSIFKSVIGHNLKELQEQFYQQAVGGVDLIKDDEILFENEETPLAERVHVCMEAAYKAKQQTGQALLYAANITGPAHQLLDQALIAVREGANALLLNVLSYGYDSLVQLSSHPEVNVPIVAHPALAGAYYPSKEHGISASVLLGKLMRLAGADLVLFPSPYGSVVMPKEENMAIKHSLTTERTEDYIHQYKNNGLQRDSFGLKTSFPVPSAGIHPALVPQIIADFGIDTVVNAGGGIHGHPQGTAAGARAFRQAIDATLQGRELSEAAADHTELGTALQLWGGSKGK